MGAVNHIIEHASVRSTSLRRRVLGWYVVGVLFVPFHLLILPHFFHFFGYPPAPGSAITERTAPPYENPFHDEDNCPIVGMMFSASGHGIGAEAWFGPVELAHEAPLAGMFAALLPSHSRHAAAPRAPPVSL